jgi:four helix bundle protein
MMDKELLKKRTKKFAVDVIIASRHFPKTFESEIISKQLIRSADSVGANYRAACRGKSKADFAYKINIVEEEADESLYLMEVLLESEIVIPEQIKHLLDEGDQLTAIFTAIGRSLKQNN